MIDDFISSAIAPMMVGAFLIAGMVVIRVALGFPVWVDMLIPPLGFLMTVRLFIFIDIDQGRLFNR